MEAYLTATKSEQQLLLDAVSSRLGKEVMANYAAFVDGMRQINEIDMEISRAGIHVSNSVRKLGSAKDSLVMGTLGITYRRRRRERLHEAKTRLQWLRSLVRVEDESGKCIATNRFADAVAVIAEANSRLREPTAARFTVVGSGSSLRSRIEGALGSLRDRVDRAVDAVALRFDPHLYAAALLGYRDLDDLGVRSSVALSAGAAASGAVTATGATASAARGRAGTTLDDGGLGDLLSGAGDGGGISGPGSNAPLSVAAPSSVGATLLLEVGSTLAAASATSSGVLSIEGIASPDASLACLPARITAAVVKSAKALSKDVLIDLLLREVRVRVDAEAASSAAAAATAYSDEDDEDDEAGPHDDDGDVDKLARELESMGAGKDASPPKAGRSTAPPQPSAAAEYATKRAELRQRPFGALAGLLAADDVPAAAIRVAAALTHAMHTHYLILQWHRAPLDPRNNYDECEFLHRCGPDDDEASPSRDAGDEDENPAHAAAAVKAATSPLSAAARASIVGTASAPALNAPALIDVLRRLRPFLLRARADVWAHMQQRFAALLFGAVGAAGTALSVERLAQCLTVARDLMSVGLEYIGWDGQGGAGSDAPGQLAAASSAASKDALIDPCNTLRGSLRLLCSNYMDATHGEAYDKLKSFLSKELWTRVPVADGAMAGIMTEAVSGARTRFSKAAVAAIAAATSALTGADTGGLGHGGDSAGAIASRIFADDAARQLRAGAIPPPRSYSDGASLFSTWLDRGNPFGCVLLASGGGNRDGATVLPTPRTAHKDDDDDDDDEADDDEDEAGIGGRTTAAAAAAARRAATRALRRIHGDGYRLDIALGRGPGLGFAVPLTGSIMADAATPGGATAGAAAGRGGDSDDDGDDDDDEIVEDDDSLTGSSEDDDDDDEPSESRRPAAGGSRRRGARRTAEGGTDSPSFAAASSGPHAAAFGGSGGHSHVVTAAALNGFARAVGKYLSLMEMLPTISADAFTGIARLFELYLYTVATLFMRPPALRALFDVATPTPTAVERERDPNAFDYTDGSALAIAARASAMAAEARSVDRRWNRGARTTSRRAPYGTADGDASGVRRTGKAAAGGTTGDARDEESVTLYGTVVYLRGLRAMAQAQGLSPEHYVTGDGAAEGSYLVGGSASSEAVYLTLRRALQQVGAELSSGVRMGTGSASALAEGVFSTDTQMSVRGYVPDPYVRLQSSIEIDGEANGHGVCERSVGVESLDFVLDVLSRVRSRIEALLPASHAASVASFYTRTVLCVTQLRALVYHSLVPRLLSESGALPSMIASVKW